ncbi:uncharacterized protein LOC110658414 [Hevea brasiliensis]|uniref:uncharacterized protein LOC110658414 n=1 Tax=Hevea brasiliensis TaxID=3981 RepID=UPI0025D06BCD|nr:uncharacterized protein LOC110658414 [Hevea brasiliensis]
MHICCWNCQGIRSPLTLPNLRNIIRDSNPGDFNCITSPLEKIGGNNHSQQRIRAFTQFIDSWGLIDIGFSGFPTTWNNRRDGLANIQERFGRFLVSPTWSLKYPSAAVTYLDDQGSDHRSILMSMTPPPMKSRKQFRFDSRWQHNPKVEQIIENTWQRESRGLNLPRVFSKLKNCRYALSH